MRIFATGTRGIPGIPGGIEEHCKHLYPELAKLGHEVCVSRRSCYVGDNLGMWNKVELVNVYSPKFKALEAIIHTMLSLFTARKWNADVIHIHAIGPALMVPLAKLLGFKVVVTNHGPDYDREKWGFLAKQILRLGEFVGCRYADEVIVISKTIQDIVENRTGKKGHLIYNGVPIPDKRETGTEFLESKGVEPGNYILSVARLVPEKGLHDLIDAFEASGVDTRLVIAGDADHESDYSLQLKRRAELNERIIMPGYVVGSDLAQLYANAAVFVLPSYHEGLPISLLEAMSHGLRILASDIEANKALECDFIDYFRKGDIKDLSTNLVAILKNIQTEENRTLIIEAVRNRYNWSKIASQTSVIFDKLQ